MNCSIFELENKSSSFEVNKASFYSSEKISIKLQKNSTQKPLGINTKYIATATVETLKPSDNLITSITPLNSLKATRKLRYDIRRELIKHDLVSKRVSSCGCVLPKKSEVIISKDDKNNSKINNVMSCGSVYECEICSTRILNQRQKDIEKVTKGWLKDKGSVLLVTFTVKHSMNDSFKSLLGDTKTKTGINGTYNRLLAHRGFRAIKDKYNIDFSVRGLETTWGLTNGFHAHIHSLFYVKGKLTDTSKEELKNDLYKLWVNTCKSSNVSIPNLEYGIDISNGSDADKYIAKWSSANELTSPAYKGAKNGNFTIWDLKNFLLNPDSSPLPINMVKSVLKEYFSTMKGKRLLTWSDSKGLRKKYLTEELTDVEIVSTSDIEVKESVSLDKNLYSEIRFKHLVHNALLTFEYKGFDELYYWCKNNQLETKGLNFLDSSLINIDDRIEELKNNYGFFPSVNDLDKDFIKYCALNYIKLLDIALYENRKYSDYGKYALYVRKFCYQFDKQLIFESS